MITLNSTLQDIVTQLVALDSSHPIGLAYVSQYQERLQVFWNDTSRVIFDVSSMSLTQNGVRLVQPAIIDVPGGFNPNNPPSSDPGAQIYQYEDFIEQQVWMSTSTLGVSPGKFVCGPRGGVITNVGSMGSHNGVIKIPQLGGVVSNIGMTTGGGFPWSFANISKIVFRAVFSFDAMPPNGSEMVFGFTDSGTGGSDSGGNLYGAFFQFCPGYSGLPDWDTRADMTPAQLAGLTYASYNGVYPGGFGYKASGLLTSPQPNTWYDAVISMITGVSCKFYFAPYGSTPVLDRVCTAPAILPVTAAAGPIFNVNSSPANPSNIFLDKVEYAVWLTEGDHRFGSLLNNF